MGGTFRAKCVALGLLGGATVAAGGEPGIRVRLFDYTGLDSEVVSRATLEATEVLGKAGIRTSWLPCKVSSFIEPAPPECGESLDELDFVLRFVRTAPAGKDLCLGIAMVTGEGGMFATVYLDRIDELVKLRIASRAQVLGHAAAHEIGHLLLGTNSHAPSGIMRASWGRGDLNNINRQWLLFSQDQSERMARTARERIASSESSRIARKR